jgi:hypothetical protein
MDAAVIENGRVANVIVVKSLDALGDGVALVSAVDAFGTTAKVGDAWKGGRFSAPAPAGEELAALRAKNAKEMPPLIDAAVAEVCARPQRFVLEYQEREAQARTYIERIDKGGGAGAAPPRIAAFAASAGMAPVAAARLTIAQADALRGALGQLSDLRMRKYEVIRASTVEAQHAVFEDVMGKIRQIAATIA